ncbi:MAG: FHA domain-containing protein [Myxococcota bacterium]
MEKLELQLLRGEAVAHRHVVTERPVMIGRAPGNDLVLAADQVSWHHAVVWVENGRLWLKDLGSTNGSFINDERIKSPTIIPPGANLRLGPSVQLRVQGQLKGDGPRNTLLMIEDQTHGLRFPLQSDRFYIGTAPNANLRLDDGDEEEAVLSIHEDGEIWLGTDDDERSVELNEPFEVAGRKLVIKEAVDVRAPTAAAERTRYAYRLTVDLQGATGPEANIEDLQTGNRSEIRSANRAVLLYILAKKLREDRENDEPQARQGWCGDEEVSSGVWGRNWKSHAGSHLHVLIHRLRKQLKSDQIDPWFIEKKRRHVRVRVEELIIRD